MTDNLHIEFPSKTGDFALAFEAGMIYRQMLDHPECIHNIGVVYSTDNLPLFTQMATANQYQLYWQAVPGNPKGMTAVFVSLTGGLHCYTQLGPRQQVSAAGIV